MKANITEFVNETFRAPAYPFNSETGLNYSFHECNVRRAFIDREMPYFLEFIANEGGKYDHYVARRNTMAGLPGDPGERNGNHIAQNGRTYPMIGTFYNKLGRCLSNAQKAAICRAMHMYCFPIHRDAVIVSELGKKKLNKKKANEFRRKIKQNISMQLINLYYNQNNKPEWYNVLYYLSIGLYYKSDLELFKKKLIDLIMDAVNFPCVNYEVQHKTTTVMSIAKQMRWEEEFHMASILADAMQDAGCENYEILEYLRNPALQMSQASWIFRSLGI